MRGTYFEILIILSSFAFSTATGAADKPNEQFWELLDKREFRVTLDPWPAKAAAELKIHGVAEESDDVKFKGTVEYRVVTEEKSKAPWVAMKQVKGKNDRDVEFEAKGKLPNVEKVFVQFKIRQAGTNEPIELTDWSIDLQK
jgi:hypothetical protein